MERSSSVVIAKRQVPTRLDLPTYFGVVLTTMEARDLALRDPRDYR